MSQGPRAACLGPLLRRLRRLLLPRLRVVPQPLRLPCLFHLPPLHLPLFLRPLCHPFRIRPLQSCLLQSHLLQSRPLQCRPLQRQQSRPSKSLPPFLAGCLPSCCASLRQPTPPPTVVPCPLALSVLPSTLSATMRVVARRGGGRSLRCGTPTWRRCSDSAPIRPPSFGRATPS